MNIGMPCICGCRRVHARLAKYGKWPQMNLTVEVKCMGCGNTYSEIVAFDGCDWMATPESLASDSKRNDKP